MKKIAFVVQPDIIKGKVPKYFFGHFLEYMHDCIDPGLWAELLISRGFEYKDTDQSGLSSPWMKVGETIKGELDTMCVYSPRQSQKICNTGDQLGGIQQENLKLYENEEYKGYLWAYCENACFLYVRILSCEKKLIHEERYQLSPGEWYQYNYSFKNEINEDNAIIQYLIEGQKTVWIDQSSLRPMDVSIGIWKNALKYIKSLRPSIMRFPGGCAADCYFWEDGIGPRDKRPSKENEHWGGIEQNHFGTDDYIEFCKEVNSEPLICVNFGSSTPEDAANWVEYCNGDLGTVYGKKRAENGHPEPYHVKYWEVGNEVFGPWEIGHCNAREYIKKYQKFASAMKQKDPNILILACGGDGGNLNQEWNQTVLSEGKGTFDALTLHLYSPIIDSSTVDDKTLYQAVAAAPVQQEKVLLLTEKTMEEVGYKVPIAVTEWNCNYGETDKSEREQTIEALVANTGTLNAFLRHADALNMCNVSDLVNGWPGGILRSSRGEVFGTATYYLIKMYVDADPQEVVACEYDSDTYAIDTIGNIESMENIPYIDIVCCKNSWGDIVVFAVNRHYSESVQLEIKNGCIRQIQRIWNEDILAKNSFEQPELITIEKEEYNCNSFEMLPHSSYSLKVEINS